MTEAEWLAAEEPERMLTYLDNHIFGAEGEPNAEDPALWWACRKLRLWAVACCRRIGHLLPDSRSTAGLDALEKYVDGLLTRERVLEAARAAAQARSDAEGASRTQAERSAASAVLTALDDITGAFDAPFFASEHAVRAATTTGPDDGRDASVYVAAHLRTTEEHAQADLLREVFGSPFRPVALDPAWLTSDVRALAHAIYTERAWDRMPILADALQEAGCESEDVLAHCRSESAPHVRGCWVVDLLLGRGGPT